MLWIIYYDVLATNWSLVRYPCTDGPHKRWYKNKWTCAYFSLRPISIIFRCDSHTLIYQRREWEGDAQWKCVSNNTHIVSPETFYWRYGLGVVQMCSDTCKQSHCGVSTARGLFGCFVCCLHWYWLKCDNNNKIRRNEYISRHTDALCSFVLTWHQTSV